MNAREIDIRKGDFASLLPADQYDSPEMVRAMQGIVDATKAPARREQLMSRVVWSLIALAALAVLAGTALAADYQCLDSSGCVAIIGDGNGKLKTVSFRRGDIVSTEDGWIVSTEDGWKRLKNHNITPPRSALTVSGYGMPAYDSLAQARAPFTFYRGTGLMIRWDGTTVLFQTPTLVASGYYAPASPTWQILLGKKRMP
jgi:hypothetical protein